MLVKFLISKLSQILSKRSLYIHHLSDHKNIRKHPVYVSDYPKINMNKSILYISITVAKRGLFLITWEMPIDTF